MSHSGRSRHASCGYFVERVVVGPTGADIRLRVEGLASLVRDLGRARGGAGGGVSGAATSLTVRVALVIHRRPGRKTRITPTGAGATSIAVTREDPAFLKALARAHRYQRLLDEGRYASITELASAERIERGYVGPLLRLTLLAPGIVEALLSGRTPPALHLPQLLEPLSIGWAGQRVALDASTRGQQQPGQEGYIGIRPIHDGRAPTHDVGCEGRSRRYFAPFTADHRDLDVTGKRSFPTASLVSADPPHRGRISDRGSKARLMVRHGAGQPGQAQAFGFSARLPRPRHRRRRARAAGSTGRSRLATPRPSHPARA